MCLQTLQFAQSFCPIGYEYGLATLWTAFLEVEVHQPFKMRAQTSQTATFPFQK